MALRHGFFPNHSVRYGLRIRNRSFHGDERRRKALQTDFSFIFRPLGADSNGVEFDLIRNFDEIQKQRFT